MNNIFQITRWDETVYSEGSNGAKKSNAQVTQTYSGLIQGNSHLSYLMSYQSGRSAVFVGFEVVIGIVNGKSGSFTLQHNGQFENGAAYSDFIVVPNSGTNELIGLEGSGSFESAEMGQAEYKITLNI